MFSRVSTILQDGELIEAQLAIINYEADDFRYTDQGL